VRNLGEFRLQRRERFDACKNCPGLWCAEERGDVGGRLEDRQAVVEVEGERPDIAVLLGAERDRNAMAVLFSSERRDRFVRAVFV